MPAGLQFEQQWGSVMENMDIASQVQCWDCAAHAEPGIGVLLHLRRVD